MDRPAHETIAQLDPRVERSRARILEAARDLMIEGGVEALTVDGVVRQTGIAKTTIYRHWPTREALLEAVLLSIKPAHPAPAAGPVRSRIKALASLHACDLCDSPLGRAFPSVLAALEQDPALHGVRDRMFEHQSQALNAILSEAVAIGEFPEGVSTEQFAAMVFGPIMFDRLILNRQSPVDFIFACIDSCCDYLEHTHGIKIP